MYLAHFGLREPPFDAAPAAGFVFPGAGQHEGNELLRAALAGEACLAAIVGESGTGKTLLCRNLLAGLGAAWPAACVADPQLEPRAFLRAIAAAFGAGDGAPEVAYVIRRLRCRLMEITSSGRSAVLCVDAAQTMPPLTLASLPLLAHLGDGQRKLLQIVLFGRPELDEMLAAHAARLPQGRVVLHHRLRRLDADEVAAYVEQRLHAAGHGGAPLFTPAALKALHYSSGGTPRVVDVLADKALFAACEEGRAQVDARHVRAAARGTAGAIHHFWWPW